MRHRNVQDATGTINRAVLDWRRSFLDRDRSCSIWLDLAIVDSHWWSGLSGLGNLQLEVHTPSTSVLQLSRLTILVSSKLIAVDGSPGAGAVRPGDCVWHTLAAPQVYSESPNASFPSL